jgi:hypothetical protein
MQNSNDTIGNQTRHLPTCSAMPQPTAPPRAHHYVTLYFVFHLKEADCKGSYMRLSNWTANDEGGEMCKEAAVF